jgi:hypothetical protein
LRYGKNYDLPIIEICRNSDGSPSGELDMTMKGDGIHPHLKKKGGVDRRDIGRT